MGRTHEIRVGFNPDASSHVGAFIRVLSLISKYTDILYHTGAKESARFVVRDVPRLWKYS